MANSKKKCKHCNNYFPQDQMIVVPVGNFCCFDHLTQFAKDKDKKDRENNKKWQKEFKERLKKNEPKKDSRDYLYNRLQELTNQYILNVRDYGVACCTCGRPYKSIAFHAGHYRSRGACKELSFEFTNIHAQCYICNSHNSGMRKEYRVFLLNKYGNEHLEWLDGPHPKLKDQFPGINDIKNQMKELRKLIRAAGLTPV